MHEMQLTFVNGLCWTDPERGMKLLVGEKEDLTNIFTDPINELRKIVFCPDCYQRHPTRFAMSFDAWLELRKKHTTSLQQCPGPGCSHIFDDLEVKFSVLQNEEVRHPSRLACARVDHHVPDRLAGLGGVVDEHTPMACKVAWKNDTPVVSTSPKDQYSFERFDNLEYRLILSNLESNATHFRTLNEMLSYGRKWGRLLVHYGMLLVEINDLFSESTTGCNIALKLLARGRWERSNLLQNNIKPFHKQSSFKYPFQLIANRTLRQLLEAVGDDMSFKQLVVSAYKVVRGKKFRPFQCNEASTLSVANLSESDVPLTIQTKNMDLRVVRQQEPGIAPKCLFVEYKKPTSERWHKCAPLTPIVFEMGEKAFVFVQPNGVVPSRFYVFPPSERVRQDSYTTAN